MQPNTFQILDRSTASGRLRATAIPLTFALVMVMAGCTGVAAELPFAAPDPYTNTGAALNGTDLRSDHLDSLQEAESFSSRSTVMLDGEDHTFDVDRTAAVDTASDRLLSSSQYNSDVVEGDGLTVTTYTNGSVSFRQVQIDAGQQTITRYDAAGEPYHGGPLSVHPVVASKAAYADLVARVGDDVNWTLVGVERYNDGWVTRYEASDSKNFSGIGSTAMAA